MGEIVSGERRLGEQGLRERAARAAAGLKSLGVGAGDVVALFLRNDFALFEASFAAGMLGAYPTPVNWHYVAEEAGYVFADCGAKVIVIHADLLPGIAQAIPSGVGVLVVETPPEIQAAYGLQADACVVQPGWSDWDVWRDSFAAHDEPPHPSPSSMIYTSGTTGRPKGVRRAPFDPQLAQEAAATQRICFGITAENAGQVVTVMVGPMYHSAPNYYGLMCAQLGAAVHLQARFEAEDLLRRIEQDRVTHLHLVPIMFNRLLKLPAEVRAKYDLSSLAFVVHAAAPCPPSVKEQMIDWWGPIISEYYGSTETGVVVACDSQQWLAHRGTVGTALPGAEVRVIDAEGRPLPAGEVGEVVARWNQRADFTYHGDQAKREAAEKGGLISPGDVGYLDEDNFLHLCDRAVDMIISGGVNIYPAEVEAALQRMPGVVDCAVFGIPDDEYGEAVYAAVQTEAGPEFSGVEFSEASVRSFLREHLAAFKVPRRIGFYDTLPREDSGKIFKRKLRDEFWRLEGRQI